MKCRLEDIADITMGQSPKSEYYNSNGDGLPFLQGNRTFGKLYPTFDTYTTAVTREAFPGDVIMSVRAPVGDLNITPVHMCLGRGVCSIRMKNGNQHFLFYVLKYCMNELLRKQSGTVFGSVNKKDIAGLEINIPEDTNEQKKMARFLFMLDEKIDTNDQINQMLEDQAKAIFKSRFIDGLADKTYNGVLSDIADITMGQSPKGESYNEAGEGTVFFQGRGEFGHRFPTIRLFTTEPKRMAKENDILLSVRAPVGDINVAHEECCIGRGLAALHAKKGYSSFLLYMMIAVQDKLGTYNNQGTVFGSINKNDLNGLPIKIPREADILEFEKVVAPMDALIRMNHDESERLAQLRDSLLPRLMTGKIKV